MYLLVTVRTTFAGTVAGIAAVYDVLPAYGSSKIICMRLVRIPDANDLLVPGGSGSLKALVCMRAVRHTQLQYGRYCSHHDDSAPVVPYHMNKSAICTFSEQCRHQRSPQIAVALCRHSHTSSNQSCCSSFVAREDSEWMPSCLIETFCNPFGPHLMHRHSADSFHRSEALWNLGASDILIGWATSHDTIGSKWQDLLSRQILRST